MRPYEVIVVRYRSPQPPSSWRAWPEKFERAGRLSGGLCLPFANALAQAFNRAEQRRPRGVWAMVREGGC